MMMDYHSQLGQDAWIIERIYPGRRDGFVVEVGAGDGELYSNSKALETLGWRGLAIDPFPTNWWGRRFPVSHAVVYRERGLRVPFRVAEWLGGIEEHLNRWKAMVRDAPTVMVPTWTLGDILAAAGAPYEIDYISIDTEGSELEVLRGFPFDRYHVGAWTIEHNEETEKRLAIRELLCDHHGYLLAEGGPIDDWYLDPSLLRSPG